MPGVIKINPDVMNDKRDALAVAWNEALRILMEDIGFTPEFQITPEQQSFLAGTAYADDPEAAAKTIVARIATFDTSIPNPTEEQVTETLRLLAMALELYGGQPDGQTLGRIKTELERVHGVEAPSGNNPPEAAPAPPEDPAREPPPEEGAPGTRNNEGGGEVMMSAAGRWADMKPAPAGTPKELTRVNGTAKGEGYFGRIPVMASPGDYMTEQSIDEGAALKPLLVPTLTPDEIVNISQGARVKPETYRKADEFAARRAAEGKSVWAQPGEQKPLHPGLLDMMNATARPLAARPDQKRMDAYVAAAEAARNAVDIVDAGKDDVHKANAYRLVLGTSSAESGHGTNARMNAPGRTNVGQFQIDRATFDVQMGRIHRDPALKQRIRSAGMDPDKWTHETMAGNPSAAAIVARLNYRKARPAIPSGDAEQAAYWRKWYNTHLDKKGSATLFLKNKKEWDAAAAWYAYDKEVSRKKKK